MATNSGEDLVPELGDFVTFTSDLYKTTTGVIVYRDGRLIRIRPVNSTQPVIEFPLEEATGLFLASLGVTEVLIHTKRSDPHFSKQLGVVPGELLEFLDTQGQQVEPSATVFEIIATDEHDAIKLEDGRVLDFQFVGPPPNYALLRARAAPEEAEEDSGANKENYVDDELPDEAFPDIDIGLLPAALVEEIPTEERTYSDGLQREDMFVSLLTDHTPERQKDPKIMSRLYRLTDVMLAMKNSMIQRDGSGAPLLGEPSFSYIATTVQEALEKQSNGAPLAALLPIAAVKKILYTDEEETLDYDEVELRNDTTSLINALNAQATFTAAVDQGNPFITYINDLLNATAAYKGGAAVKIAIDQDVLRTQVPPTPVMGFPSTGPAFNNEGPVPLMENALGTITKQAVRLLGPSRIRNPKTNTSYVVAPADSGEVRGHLLLTQDLLRFRSPIRSSHLLWDIQNSELSRSSKQTYYTALRRSLDAQTVVLPDSINPLRDEFTTRCQTALQFNDKGLVSIMDSLGLRTLEITDDIMEPITNAVVSGIQVWDTAYKNLGLSALDRMKAPSIFTIDPVGSDLWTDVVLKNPIVEPYVSIMKQKESTLADYDLMLANDTTAYAGGTLGPFINGLLGGIDVVALESDFKNETAREERNKATVRETAKLLQSSPDLNPCVHVKELDKLRGIRDDSKRMIIFDKFVKKFSGGQAGNYILCGNCGKDLVCKHEIILLNEYLNPGRSVALHKTLLLEYAGPVFEGAYICKTCGQKIMDIEYDTHIEFDDEGRPLMGRTVLENTDDAEDEYNVAIAAEAESDIPFVGAQRKLYFQERALFELCGLALNLDVYKRTVAALTSYIDAFGSTEEAYLASQERTKAAMAKQGKKYTGVPFINYQSTQIIGAIGAFAVLEIQTNPVNIPIAAPGCTLSRTGFPLDGVDPATAGTGALDYAACALASIKRNDVPWNKVIWSAETDMKRRVEQSKNNILLALAKILGIQLKGMPAIAPLDNVTQLYRDLLERTRGISNTKVGVTDAALSSSSDKLPPVFRPLQRLAGIDTEAIGNVQQFSKNVRSGNLLPVRKVTYERQLSLNMNLMGTFHTNAQASGVVQENNPCSESVCCTRSLADLEQTGNGVRSLDLPEAVAAEVALMKDSAVIIARRDPAVSNAGTHIYVPWSAPLITNVLPTPDASVYYKLFLKACYRGRKYGSTHELNNNSVCRNCGFHFPEELMYLNAAEITETGKKQEAAIDAMNKERERLALTAFSTQGVEITEDKFRDLEEAIRTRKLVTQVIPLELTKFFASLEQIGAALAPPSCNVSTVEDWQSFITGMTKIQQEERKGPQRLGPLVDFSRRYDKLLGDFRSSLLAHASQKTRVPTALDSLVTITANTDSHTVIRTLTTQFVVVAQQVATTYKIRNPPVRKWFPKVNRDHAESLKKIWEVFAAVTEQTVHDLDDIDERAKPIVITALLRFSAVFGSVLHIWKQDLRPTLGFTPEEYTQALRWTLVTLLSHLTNPTSVFFDGSPSATVTAHAMAALADWIVLAANTSGNIAKKYVLSDEEIRSRVNARVEQEKAMFIAKMDKQEQEMRKLELVKKKLKIGDWAVGSQNLFKYNSNMYEFERSQRAAMGLPEFTEDVTGAVDAAAGGDFYDFAVVEPGMEEGELHRAAQDEDENDDAEAGRLHYVC